MSKPFWLSAYPNEGTLDYFGFRFYRQPLRKYLTRGAAANNFKNAKTLIFYAAITYGFRKKHLIEFDAELTSEQLSKWEDWYKSANYLYVVNRYSKYGEVPDSGFTGASDESKNHFQQFFSATTGQFNIHDTFSRIYPKQRNWGYLTQFWVAPLKYFRCVIDIKFCISGEYAEKCYELLSKNECWSIFVNALMTGEISREQLNQIQKIIDSKKLSFSEQELAQKIIFDENKVTLGENDEYKKSFRLLQSLQEEGFEKFYPRKKDDFAMVFSYMQLKNISIGENDLSWKLLVSSIVFEIGINRLYTLLRKWSKNGVLDLNLIQIHIENATQDWMAKNEFSGNVFEVEQQWKQKHLNDIDAYDQLFKKMLDIQVHDCAFDGLLQGYIISKIKPSLKQMASESYQAITEPYHHFAPQPFFDNKKIDLKLDFKDFIYKVIIWLINDQFDFSLERMSYGQKAKFILSKSEFDEQYLFQIDAQEFIENRGVIDMIDASLNLWETAGILKAS